MIIKKRRGSEGDRAAATIFTPWDEIVRARQIMINYHRASVSMFASLTHLLFRSNTLFSSLILFLAFFLLTCFCFLLRAFFPIVRSFVRFFLSSVCSVVTMFCHSLQDFELFVCMFVCLRASTLFVCVSERVSVSVSMYLSKKSVMLFVIFRWSAAGFAFGLGDGGKMSMCVKWPDCLNVRTHTRSFTQSEISMNTEFLWAINGTWTSEWIREQERERERKWKAADKR